MTDTKGVSQQELMWINTNIFTIQLFMLFCYGKIFFTLGFICSMLISQIALGINSYGVYILVTLESAFPKQEVAIRVCRGTHKQYVFGLQEDRKLWNFSGSTRCGCSGITWSYMSQFTVPWGGIAYNSSIVVTSWKTSKPGAFDLNIMELSAYVRKQTYG